MTEETIEYENVHLVFEGPLAILTLNAPASLNAIGEAMAGDIITALNEIVKPRRRCRAVMLTGNGRAFSAGVNLMGRRNAARDGQTTLQIVGGLETIFNPMLRRLHGLRIPVIAAVNGLAIGIGLGIVMTADHVIAAESAWFQTPFGNLASAPDSGLTWLLPRAIGTTRARRMLLNMEKVDARTALDWGLIAEVVPDNVFAEEAKKVALRFANGASVALGEIKALINEGLRADLNSILEAEAVAVARTARTKDNLTAVKMFAGKEKPVFTGE